MSTWPSPSGFRLTACAAPATPSAPIPASAAHSDFFLKIFMVGDDSVELPFKVITLETTAIESYYSFVFPYKQFGVAASRYVGFLQRMDLTPIHEPCLTLRDDPFFHQRSRDALDPFVVIREAQLDRAAVCLAIDVIYLYRTVHSHLVFRLIEIERHRRSRGRTQILVRSREIAIHESLPPRLGECCHRFVFHLGWRIGRETSNACTSAHKSDRQYDRGDYRVSSFGDGTALEVPQNVAKHPLN